MGFVIRLNERLKPFNSELTPKVERFTAAWSGGILISFLWGLSEGIFFFIVPDVIVAYIALYNIKKGIYSLFSTVIGSLASAAIMFYLTIKYSMEEFLLKIPLINQHLLDVVKQQYQEEGMSAILSGPMSGIPYKIYSVEAAKLNLPLTDFVLYSIPSRLSRILPAMLIALIIGIIFRKMVRSQPMQLLFVYCLFWISVYVFYALLI